MSGDWSAVTYVAIGMIGGYVLARLGGNLSRASPKVKDDGDNVELTHKPKGKLIKGNYKMVLCVRMDLKMQKGKIAAQCGHATLGTYQRAVKYCPDIVKSWSHYGQAKIALKCPNEETMMLLKAKADSLNLVNYIVMDAGRTQIAAGSTTVLGILGPVDIVNEVTAELKLL